MLPEILLFGEAGSGKDTVAQILVEHHGAVALAMADPMKRFAAAAFGFSEETLWGPSHLRNAMDPRFRITALNGHAGYHEKYTFSEAWHVAREFIDSPDASRWLVDLLDNNRARWGGMTPGRRLQIWFDKLRDIAFEQGGLSARTMLQTLGTEWGRHIDDLMWIRYAQRVQRKLLSGGYTYDRTKGLVAAPGQKYNLAVVTDGRFRNECLEFKAGGATVIQVFDPSARALAAGVQGHASEAEQRTVPRFWFDYVLKNDKALGLKELHFQVANLACSFQNGIQYVGRG